MSNSESIDAGRPVAVFLITAHIGLVKLRIVWIKYLEDKSKILDRSSLRTHIQYMVNLTNHRRDTFCSTNMLLILTI